MPAAAQGKTRTAGHKGQMPEGDRRMIFVTGPLFAGKQTYIMEALGWDETAFKSRGVREVEELAADLAEQFDADPAEESTWEKEEEIAVIPAAEIAADQTEKFSEEAEERSAADPAGESAMNPADRKNRNLSEALQNLADALAQKEVVIATETGGGVVPLDPRERRNREAAGRLACLLAGRADTVIRVCCGLPQFLKGQEF